MILVSFVTTVLEIAFCFYALRTSLSNDYVSVCFIKGEKMNGNDGNVRHVEHLWKKKIFLQVPTILLLYLAIFIIFLPNYVFIR